jgi:hypothetical protein
MVGAIEGCEALEVCGGPSVFALEELVDFPLGCRTLRNGVRIVIFSFADSKLRGANKYL